MSIGLLPLSLAILVVVGVAGVWIARSRREARDERLHGEAVAKELHLPDSLHPLINPDLCIGSLSCITACPEGDILGIVDGSAKLIVGSNCIGHGRCALECPVDAIKLVFGHSQRGVDLPEVDENFESSRPGVQIVGELGGMGLIKNAFRQGLQAADHLRRVLPRAASSSGDVVDVLIVGAGPAGLATALGCRAHGLSLRIVEQSKFGGTVAHYPRQKIVMTERIELPILGKFGRATMSKEDLLAAFDKIRRRAKLDIEEGVTVDKISGTEGDFTVQTTRGPIRARRVVLATGRRGSPRLLEAEGADLEKVTYSLVDAEQYQGQRMLVVGGGDSAIEAACSLAEQPGNQVTISYRRGSFGKCRDANRKRIGELIANGKVRAIFDSEVRVVRERDVLLKTPSGDQKLANDYVLACLGGELPTALLQKLEINVVRHRGERGGHRHDSTAKRESVDKAKPAAAKPRTYRVLGLTLIGAFVVGTLFFLGSEYYLLPARLRARSPLHELMRPAGVWGHGIGIVATGVMLLNFLYPLRKRLGFLKGTAPIRTWLQFHIFVGIMSPLVIAFHAAFQSRNLLATVTYVALLVVVLTGLFGRFVYGLVPSAGGKAQELSMVRGQLSRHEHELGELVRGEELQALLGGAIERASKRTSLLGYLLSAPLRRISRWWMLHRARRLFSDADGFAELERAFLEYETLAVQTQFYGSLRRLLSAWRAFHVVLSVLLVGIIAVHVWLSIYLGYRWIYR